jgi:NTP pyrophosphatase (non-canonical NTP hydrolase)
MNAIQVEILNKAIDKFGTSSQIDKAIEEMSELTKALLKERYARKTDYHFSAIDNVCEELADVIIMLEQVKIIFTERYKAISKEDLQNMIDYKIERLKGKL